MVVFYCGRDHQTADWNNHKADCNVIRRRTSTLNAEEQRLRSQPPGDIFTPDRLFEDHVGDFWGIMETRTYMRARYALVEALLKIDNFAAVNMALEHLLAMLVLCSSDNMGLRDQVPGLLLRVQEEQKCYDFILWWIKNLGEGDFDPALPKVEDADVFGPVDPTFTGKYRSLSHTVAITLLKIRLLQGLRALHNSTPIGTKTSQELFDNIRESLVEGTPIAGRDDILSNQDQSQIMDTLQRQVQQMYAAVSNVNKHLWPAMLEPGSNLTARPEFMSAGTPQEMQITLQYNYKAWSETPGAIQMIQRLHEGGSP